MTAWLVVLVAGVALAGTWRLRPTWQRPSWILLSVLAVFVVLMGNDARRFAPIVVAVLGAGLLLPTGTIHVRGRRMAPTMDEARKTPGARLARPGKIAEGYEASVFAELAIPGYDLVERIGSGGMATVYRGVRRSDGTPVAVKIPMEQYTQDGTFLRRFHREAEVAQRIDHPNVVRTYDHGTVGAQHYLTMEFVDGDSLETFMEHGPVDVPFFVDVALPVVEALAAIHRGGLHAPRREARERDDRTWRGARATPSRRSARR
jgi:Serine/threonine protein kinase